MKVLVIGASGYIGYAVASALARAGWKPQPRCARWSTVSAGSRSAAVLRMAWKITIARGRPGTECV